jgi:hypothetical protein
MLGHALLLAGIVLGPIGLVLHFYVAIEYGLANGYSIAGAVVFYLSFFTIQTHILAVLAYWAGLPSAPSFLAPFQGARMKATIVVALSVVMVVYVVALQNLWDPQGVAYAGDLILHYLAPVIFLVWWLVAGRDGSLRFRHLPWLVVFPLAYFAYVMARAAIAGEVPYPFLDYTQLGLAALIRSVVSILLLFLGFAAVYVLVDRSLRDPKIFKSQA